MRSLIIILIFTFLMSCKGQIVKQENKRSSAHNYQSRIADTLSVLILKDKKHEDILYKVLFLYNLDDNGCRIKSTRRIELKGNDSIYSTINLPNSEDLKNFSVNRIIQANSGFRITVNWGSGSYFYKRDFRFNFVNSQFALESIRMSFYCEEDDNEEKVDKIITPPIPIQKFKIVDYLHNE